MLMSALTLPNIQRSSPVTVTADTPVLNILQPVAKTSFTDAFRNPVDGVVIADQVIFDSCHLDEPGFSCVVDQRSVASPAVRIAVFKLRCIKQKSSLIEVFQHERICFFYKDTAKRCIFRQVTFAVNQLYKRQSVFTSDFRIVFTKCRCDMNDTGTICQCYVSITNNIKCFFVLFFCMNGCTAVQWFVLFIFQVCSFVILQYIVSIFAEHLVSQSLCNVINTAVFFHLNFYIILIRVYAKCKVGRQCPWCGCPCQNVSVLVFDFETYNSRTFFYVLVTLCHFLGRKRSTAARAVRNDLESFVQQAFFPDGFQCPPFRLDIVIIIGNIRIFHVSPETNRSGEIFPHAFVFPYTLFTFINERNQSIFFDLIFSVQTEHFFYFQLNRQTVCIPSGFTRNHFAFHGLISRNHIFDNTGQNMSDMRFAVSCWRSVIKGVSFTFFTVFHTLFKDVIFFPEFLNIFFSVYEIQICRNFFVHKQPPVLIIRNKSKSCHPVKG